MLWLTGMKLVELEVEAMLCFEMHGWVLSLDSNLESR